MEYFILCIGNRDGGDDSIGPYIADKLKEQKLEDLVVLDCGIIPENYTLDVKRNKPKNLIIIDAVEMNLKPGKIRIIPKEKISVMHISTHGIPIPVLIGYLESYVKDIFFIGIQPKTMSGGLTDIIKKSGDKLIDILKNKNIKQIKTLQ